MPNDTNQQEILKTLSQKRLASFLFLAEEGQCLRDAIKHSSSYKGAIIGNAGKFFDHRHMERWASRVAKKRQGDRAGGCVKKKKKKAGAVEGGTIPKVLMQMTSFCNKPINSKGSKINKIFLIQKEFPFVLK